MSEENLEVVRRSARDTNAFMCGELSSEALAERFDPEVEVHWRDRQTYPDTPQRLQGVRELLAFSEQWREGWADTEWQLLELKEAPGDRVLGFVRQTARGRQSGVPIEIHFFGIWTIRDGSVAKVEYVRHRTDALEAAGLSE
jgi:ketosteroid isomerase-like protein